ncbi:MAG: acyl--CoA ligase [Actinomycetota bacterium]|nr:acyl--CoA ligase [Actinomycetota bacterium]
MNPAALHRQKETTSSDQLLASFLHLGDREVGGRVAVATKGDDSWDESTYEQLDRQSAQFRAWLAAHGVDAGDRVGLLGESGSDWVAAFLGVLRRGAVALPLDTRLTGDELSQIWTRSAPAALVVSGRFQDSAHAVLAGLGLGPPVLLLDRVETCGEPWGHDVTRSTDETAVVVWTSGTTGTAKGVCLSFANLDYVVTQSVAAQGAAGDDNWLSLLSLSHMLELSCGLLASLRCGATFCFGRSLMPREVVEAMGERGVTRMMVVPLVLRLLADELAHHPDVTGRLRALYSGGAPLSRDLIDRYADMGVPVYQGYGLTELAPVVSMNSARHDRPGSVGRPLPGTEVCIRGGEILVRSPGLMTGYWLADDLTHEVIDDEGWFHTGDLGRVDADGYLYVTGRAKNLIVLDSGKKVHPEEVEAVLATSTMFAEVCVVGVHVEDRHVALSEQVGVVVVPTDAIGAQHRGDDELRAALAAEVERLAVVLSGYKRPTVVEIWRDELPKTVKRSVRRAQVTEMVRRRREGS